MIHSWLNPRRQKLGFRRMSIWRNNLHGGRGARGLQSTGSQRVGHGLVTKQQLYGGFGLRGGSALLTPVLLSGQLHFVIKEK